MGSRGPTQHERTEKVYLIMLVVLVALASGRPFSTPPSTGAARCRRICRGRHLLHGRIPHSLRAACYHLLHGQACRICRAREADEAPATGRRRPVDPVDARSPRPAAGPGHPALPPAASPAPAPAAARREWSTAPCHHQHSTAGVGVGSAVG